MHELVATPFSERRQSCGPAVPRRAAAEAEVRRAARPGLRAQQGLTWLSSIAESLMLHTGGCSGCTLSGTCRVCRPSQGTLFVEGCSLDHSWVFTQQREAVLNPHVWGISPALRRPVEEDG